MAEMPFAPWCLKIISLGVSFLRLAVGKAAVVSPRNNNDFSFWNLNILDKKYGCYESCRFIGVGTSQDQKVASLFLSFIGVNLCVSPSFLQSWEVGAEHFFGCKSTAGEDSLFFFHAEKFESGEEANDEGKEKKKSGDEVCLYILHGLFDQKEPEEKHDENKSDTGLVPEFFLAEKTPDEMACQVKNNKMVNDLHFFL